MQLFRKPRKEEEPKAKAPTNLSDALASFRNGGAKPEEEKKPTDAEWLDIWRRLRPYTKTLAEECANLYTKYVEAYGKTTCPAGDISFHMGNLLWEAYRRAGIKELYPHVNTLPNLAPYFIDTVRLLNSRETPGNHVAYVSEKDPGTNEVAWYVTPVDEAKRNPKVPTGKKYKVEKILR